MVFAGKTLKTRLFPRHLHLVNVYGLENVAKYAIHGVFGFGIPGKTTGWTGPTCRRCVAGTVELAQFVHGLGRGEMEASRGSSCMLADVNGSSLKSRWCPIFKAA